LPYLFIALKLNLEYVILMNIYILFRIFPSFFFYHNKETNRWWGFSCMLFYCATSYSPLWIQPIDFFLSLNFFSARLSNHVATLMVLLTCSKKKARLKKNRIKVKINGNFKINVKSSIYFFYLSIDNFCCYFFKLFKLFLNSLNLLSYIRLILVWLNFFFYWKIC